MEIIISIKCTPSFYNLRIMEIIISDMAKIGGVDYYAHFLRWTQHIGALIWVNLPWDAPGVRVGYEIFKIFIFRLMWPFCAQASCSG